MNERRNVVVIDNYTEKIKNIKLILNKSKCLCRNEHSYGRNCKSKLSTGSIKVTNNLKIVTKRERNKSQSQSEKEINSKSETTLFKDRITTCKEITF